MTQTVAEVADRLREQYARTGCYDAADLTFVLGDPMQGVFVPVCDPWLKPITLPRVEANPPCPGSSQESD